MWTSMGLKTLQPKWHMTFGGHLLEQVIRYGGLADKADDTIELQHQILKKLRDRYRNITSFQRRVSCIRRELRRRKSTEIQSHIDQYERSIRVRKDSRRHLEVEDRHKDQRKAKRVKREGVLDG